MTLLFPALFQPWETRGIRIPNRIVRSATAENLTTSGGLVDDRFARLQARLARGGVGLIIVGVAYISPEGAMTTQQTGIHHDDTVPGLRRAVEATRTAGEARIVCQIGHAGRQTNPELIGQVPVAPSEVRDISSDVLPRALAGTEVQALIDRFADAARRAEAAGFDGVQLHGAHGYLIHQFLSPRTNKRTDQWGGDTPERRMHFLEEVYRACRAALGEEFLVMVKLNGEDFVPGGVELEQTAAFVRRLSRLGADGVEISGGTYEAPWRITRGSIPFDMYTQDESERLALKPVQQALQPRVGWFEGYHLRHAQAIKAEAGNMAVISVGGWRTPLLMEQAVARGDTDFISLCRPLIRNPKFPNQIRAGAVVPSSCASCNRCLIHETWGDPVRCYYREGLRAARLKPPVHARRRRRE